MLQSSYKNLVSIDNRGGFTKFDSVDELDVKTDFKS